MLSIFKKNKPLFVLTMLLSALFSAVVVVSAFVLENILNAATYGDWALFRNMIGVVVAYVVVVAALATGYSMCVKKLLAKTVYSLRQDLFRGVLARDPEQFYKVNTADYISALTNDVKTVEESLLVPLLQTVQYGMVFVMAAAALVYYNPLIAGLMLLCLAAMYLVPASFGRPIGRRQGLLSGSFATFTIHLKDQLSGYDVIRSHRLVGRAEEDFTARNRELRDRKYAVDRLSAVSNGIAQVLGAGCQLMAMLAAAYLVLRGRMTAGMLLGLVDLSGSLVQPVAVVMQSIPQIRGARPVLERIERLGSPGSSVFSGRLEPVFEEGIRFDGVSFGYLPEQAVLKDVDLALVKNGKYAVVGASGSGKSTLVKLLAANYGGYRGAIAIDGTELRQLDLDRFLSMVSVISQNVYLFDGTIRDNIGLYRDYSRLEWESALSASGVDHFLDQAADGLDTAVGENGINLSGGQRQRVVVARALLERKPILILDEGTSAVDAKTAWEIETALLEIPDITLLTITHNLDPDLLSRYDGLVYLEDGRVAAAGCFDELAGQDAFGAFLRIKTKGAV